MRTSSLVIPIVTALLAWTPVSQSAEIRVLIVPGMSKVMERLGAQFQDRTGHKLLPRVGLTSQLRTALEAGDFDVAIFGATSIDAFVKHGTIISGTQKAIARVGIGVAIRKGAPKPDISTTEAFKAALLNAKAISYTRDSGTGKYLAGLMERLGIAAEMKPKTTLLGGGGQNPKAVAAGDVELGISVISDIIPVEGVELLGPLPPELQQYATFTAGIGTTNLQAARELVDFLTSPTVASVIEAGGLQPVNR